MGDDFDSSAAWVRQSGGVVGAAIKVRKMLSNPRGDESQMKVRNATATTTKTRGEKIKSRGKIGGWSLKFVNDIFFVHGSHEVAHVSAVP